MISHQVTKSLVVMMRSKLQCLINLGELNDRHDSDRDNSHQR